MHFLVKRVPATEAPSNSLTWRQGLRSALLHVAGGGCAIVLLALGISLVSEFFPHTKESFRRFAGAVFNSDDEPKLERVASFSRATTPEAETAPASAPVHAQRRRVLPSKAAAPRYFFPPPPRSVPSPQLVENGPSILAVADWSLTVPEFDLAALPPRPSNPVLRVLAVLSQPFRFLGGLFNRRADASRHISSEDYSEPLE